MPFSRGGVPLHNQYNPAMRRTRWMNTSWTRAEKQDYTYAWQILVREDAGQRTNLLMFVNALTDELVQVLAATPRFRTHLARGLPHNTQKFRQLRSFVRAKVTTIIVREHGRRILYN